MARKKFEKHLPENWQEALQQFIFWKQAQGLSERTINDYRYHVSQFYNQFPKAYDEKNLAKYLLAYMAQPIKPATFNLRLVYLKAFINWYIDEGIFTANPLAKIKRKRTREEFAILTTKHCNNF
ncbi:hypothetical protein N752_11710 [Desulforamulus aquiferis]|nr:phage integrase N-terminal SAM-like domain-containing protein [Desulforamulus aquiferis]RYD05023.1 hypothetical protein N752_11710 [Desulforamulus aquiferis]